MPLCAAVLPGCPPAAASWKLRPLDALLSLQRSWALITSSSLFKRLALCMAIVGVVSEGIQDMLIQYLQLVVGFNTADQSLLFTLLGAANLVVQVCWVVPASSQTCMNLGQHCVILQHSKCRTVTILTDGAGVLGGACQQPASLQAAYSRATFWQSVQSPSMHLRHDCAQRSKCRSTMSRTGVC
jgi:hypothetical protein